MTHMIGAKEMQRTINRPSYLFSFFMLSFVYFRAFVRPRPPSSLAQGEKEYHCYGCD